MNHFEIDLHEFSSEKVVGFFLNIYDYSMQINEGKEKSIFSASPLSAQFLRSGMKDTRSISLSM